MTDWNSTEPADFYDEAPSETPFDPAEGIWFKYGRLFTSPAQLAQFEAHCGYTMPTDFVRMIGQHCEGGFDGWYRVAKGEFGSIVWASLLLMRLPVEIDFEMEASMRALPGMPDHTSITTSILERERSIFYADSGELLFFPFGRAYCFRPGRHESSGYLVFDLREKECVRYISRTEPRSVAIASSFGRMMSGAVFQFYG